MKNYFYTALLLILFPFIAKAQWGHSYGTMQAGLGMAKTDIGQSINANFNYYLGAKLSFEPKLNMEWGRLYQTVYSNVALDAGLKYSVVNMRDRIYFNVLMAGFVGGQKLAKLTPEFNKRKLSYGGKGGGEIEAYLTSTASISLFCNQLLFLQKQYGTKGNEFGLQVKVNIN